MIPAEPQIDLEHFLKNIPIFSSIPDFQLRKIASCFHISRVKKDEIIFRQNESSDAMYIIHTGAVLIYAENNLNRTLQFELRRGDFFGEMALLSDQARNATAKVSLDAVLFQLKKEDFTHLLAENKQIGLFLSRLYARRLSSGYESRLIRRDPVFYTLCATDPDLGLSHFLYSMSYHISTESSKCVLVVEPYLEARHIMERYGLNISVCPDESLFGLLPPNVYSAGDFKWFVHPSGFTVLQVNKGFNEKLVPALPQLMDNFKTLYDLVIFSLSHRFGNLEQQAVRLCDKNLLLINNTTGALEDVRRKLRRIEEIAGTGLDRVRVGVSHLCGTHGIARSALKESLNLSETPQIWVDRCDKALKDSIDTEKRFPVRGARALAREIAGVRIGLALGAGAARGWSHIGVLKVLEEEGIHIDMIAGTSMGALVGAIYAASGSVKHLRKHTIEMLGTRTRARKKIFDYTLPFHGLLKGRKAMNLVANAIRHADFMDLLIPTYLVGVDVIKGEEILFETGDVSKAVRSSLSLPVVFAPYRHAGRWMVDGGLLNPVPVNILEQKGADKVIAVCVENRRTIPDQIEKSPGIMGVISRTISIVHGRATSGFVRKSDVVIYPDVQGFAWDDFHRGHVLMHRGITACKEVIDDIKALVDPGQRNQRRV